MRKLFFTAALAVLAVLAFAATASADVARYQLQTATFTVTQPADAVGQWQSVWTHAFTVRINPCDGTFTGAGKQYYNGTYRYDETVSGTLGASWITMTAVRSVDPVTWTLSHASFGGVVTLATTTPSVSWPIEMKVTQPVITGATSFRNHGDYVKSQGGGSDAAHSCIGMPMRFDWTQSGTVAPTMTGTSVALPIAGTYRIDVSGTWVNTSHGLVDAEYDNGDHGTDWSSSAYTQDGWPGLGANWGDLTVGGAFVDWGPYNAAHAYSYTASFGAGALDLALLVFDGQGGVPVPGWYGDNTGSLSYTITYVGP